MGGALFLLCSSAISVGHNNSSRRTHRSHHLSSCVRTFDPPNFDHTRPVSTNNATSEWGIDAGQRGNTVLMGLEQILLIVRDQTHSLRGSIALRLTARWPGPHLDKRSRIALRSHGTPSLINRRTISSIPLRNGDSIRPYSLVPGLFDFRFSPTQHCTSFDTRQVP